MIEVIKRDCSKAPFNPNKIEKAILKAMKYGSGRVQENIAEDIANEIEIDIHKQGLNEVSIYEIERLVFEKLCNYDCSDEARAYESYRAIREHQRKSNTSDDSIMGLVHRINSEVMNENSNKNATLVSTQRDLIAGEVSKDVMDRRTLPTHIVQAHNDGVLHYHDKDYALQPMFNCQLVDLKDMLDNGTVISNKMVRSPNSFQVACTVMTQIMAQVASSQYGGQSMYIQHLGKYLRRSKERYEKLLSNLSGNAKIETVNALLQKELESGVQTIQYQVNTIMSTNGQSPFVTLFLDIPVGDEYEQEVAMIIQEVLKQRLDGMENEAGIVVTPTFPKLIYVLREHNCLEGGKYDYLTNLAVECSSRRLYPDYISAKEMEKNYEGQVFSCMGCRSFLSPWKDENGDYKWEGRFNQGVVSINLPQIGIIANGDEKVFWELLHERLLLCKEALLFRHELLKGTISDVSPIHWQHGAVARLKPGETIDHLLMDGYSTISLGYIGVYETTKLMTGEPHTTVQGQKFAIRLMKVLNNATNTWKLETGLGFGLYGSPAESLCYRFAKIDKEKYGEIEDVTSKGYYTNSYHVDVREEIDAFSKLKFESQFQSISTGGCISYVEIPNMMQNLDALKTLVNFIYHNIQYAEFNCKSDCCNVCGYEGEILINDDMEWECPQCGNKDQALMSIVRRTSGYLGANYWNKGKTQEIKSRVLHL